MKKRLTGSLRLDLLFLLAFAVVGSSCSSDSDGGGASTQAPAGATGQSSSTAQAGSAGASSAAGGASSSTRKGSSSSGGGSSVGGRSRSGGAGEGGSSSSALAGSSAGSVGTDGASSASGGGTSRAGGSSQGGTSRPGGRPDATGGTGGAGTSAAGAGPGGASGSGGSTGTMPSGTPVKSVGCGKTSSVKFTTVPGESGSNVGTGEGGYVTVNGRGFAMRLPDNYDNNKPYWLIFGFHWNGGTSKDVDTGGSNGYVMAHFGLQALSKNGAIFVAPQGNGNGWGGNNLPFIDDMVKLIKENYCVDETRLYANGFSYGGGMSYAIACARAKVFRAVAIYNGAELSGCDGGQDPIAYWQMAGTTDGTCRIDQHATPMRNKFVKNNGCTGPTSEPPRPKSISEAHICTDYTGCKAGYPLRWCVHPAGHGNAIVDGTGDLYNSCATPPKTCSDSCKCTWVPADVWKFFTSL